MEIWDIYDINGQKTGRTIERGKRLEEGDYHLVVHIWPKDELGRFLIQKRAPHLDLLPDTWAATGGSAFAGEDSLSAAMREAKEELGLSLRPDDMTFVHRIIRPDKFTDIWVANVRASVIDEIILSPEVSEVMWETGSEMLNRTRKSLFYDYGDDYFSFIL